MEKIRLHQEVDLSGETVSPIITLFWYMKYLQTCDGLNDFISTKMINLTTVIDNHIK